MKKEKREYEPEFIRIPFQLFKNENLYPADRPVYGIISYFTKMKDKHCKATNKTIAKLLSMHPTSVSDSLSRLEDNKCILRVFDPKNKRKRIEIIPLMEDPKLIKYYNSISSVNEIPISSDNEIEDIKAIRQQARGVSSTGKGGFVRQRTAIPPKKALPKVKDKAKESQNTLVVKDKNHSSGNEIDRLRTTTKEKNDKELPLRGQIIKPLGKKNGKDLVSNKSSADFKLNDVIALFLPLFPGDFANKKSNPFSNQTTRDVVEALMKRKSFEEIKYLIQKFADGKTNLYRPYVGAVYEFCTSKLAKVEDYAAKNGGLWAQRSISTPEQRADSDEIMRKLAEKDREQQQRDKEEWERTHLK